MLNIKGSDDCIANYNKLQLKKKGDNDSPKWIVFAIQKSKEGGEAIEVETLKIYEKDCQKEVDGKMVAKTDDDFLTDFTTEIRSKKEKNKLLPRFGVIDYMGKVFFVAWSPERNGSIKEKMKYTSIKEAFIQQLNGVSYKVQATEDSEIDQSVFQEIIKKNAIN